MGAEQTGRFVPGRFHYTESMTTGRVSGLESRGQSRTQSPGQGWEWNHALGWLGEDIQNLPVTG